MYTITRNTVTDHFRTRRTLVALEDYMADEQPAELTDGALGSLADALLAKNNVEVHFSTVVAGYRTENGKFTGLDLKKDSGEEFSVTCDGAFLAVGLQPENEAFASLARLNDWGYFDSAEDCTTCTPGLYVAGDCRSKRIRQVVTASADGAIAAMAACRYLDT